MAKCGKGCMPECEYFTTGGCISPFNCMYKEESKYINSATSGTVIYAGGMNMTDEEMIENLKCVIEDISEQCERLKAENAALRERMEKAVELPCKIGDRVYAIFLIEDELKILDGTFVGIEEVISDFKGCMCAIIVRQAKDGHYFNTYWDLGQFNKTWWADKRIAEARLKELQGGEE